MEKPVMKSHSHQSNEKDLCKVEAEVVGRRTRNALVLLVMELCETEDRKECEEQQHRVEEDEPRNGKPRNICPANQKQPETPSTKDQHTTKDHKRRQMTRPPTHPKLHGSIPPKRDHSHTKRRQHNPHRDIRHLIRVNLPTLKLEAAIVACQQACKTDEHLAEGWMHVEIELALEIVRAEFAEMGFVPDDDVGSTNFVEAGPAGEEGVDDGWDMFHVLHQEFTLRMAARISSIGEKRR